jgi:hypothetical protein
LPHGLEIAHRDVEIDARIGGAKAISASPTISTAASARERHLAPAQARQLVNLGQRAVHVAAPAADVGD